MLAREAAIAGMPLAKFTFNLKLRISEAMTWERVCQEKCGWGRNMASVWILFSCCFSKFELNEKELRVETLR